MPDFTGYTYNAVVVRVVDGDTVDLDVDLGFHLRTRQRFRLLGIDAPELRSSSEEDRVKAQAALAFLLTLLPVGSACVVESTKADSFGRYLGSIWNDDTDVTVNRKLLDAGHAVPRRA